MTFDSYSNILLALCIWREARGESDDAKSGVKHVILNRVANPSGPFVHCKGVVENILCPYQFSSFNRGDPNASQLPNPANASDWAAWQSCCNIVDVQDADPSLGANYYFDVSIAPPSWAMPDKQTVQLGRLKFFRL